MLVLGGTQPPYLQRSRWLIEVARDGKGPRIPHLVINNILGVLRACQRGLGIAMLPDYLVEENGGLVQLFGEAEAPALDAYFVYPEELKTVARVQAFRDFLVVNAQRWAFLRSRNSKQRCVSKARVRRCCISSNEIAISCATRARIQVNYCASFSHGWHVNLLVVCADRGSHSIQMLRGNSVAPSSQMATIMLAAVPSGR